MGHIHSLSMFVCISSEEEQFFINAQLPDFHQVDIPDLWIGISGEWYSPCKIIKMNAPIREKSFKSELQFSKQRVTEFVF